MEIQSSAVNLNSNYEKISFSYEKLNFKIITSDSKENKKSSLDLNVELVKLDIKQINLDKDEMDPEELKSLIIKLFIEKITGKKLKNLSLKDLKKALNSPEVPTQIPQFAAEINYEKIQYEKENVNFKAEGKVITKDGKEIKFQLNFSLNRELLDYTKLNIKAGSAALVDPIIINFDGNLNEILSNSKFNFDLDSDGTEENISLLNSGNGFLVFDRNDNGKVDNGSELFGTKTGNGFEELKEYDNNKNNWIDEGDKIFDKLKVWIKTPSEDRLVSLKSSDIGSIYINNAPTPFSLNGGKLGNSSVYLTENGDVGMVSKIDFVV